MGEKKLLIQAGWSLDAAGARVGCGGPRRLLGHRLSNSVERANPSVCTAGPPSKDGCQTLRSSAKKTNKGTFKNSRVKERFFFFFCSPFSLLSSTNSARSQLMISFPLSPSLKLRGIVTCAGFRSRFPFPECGRLPSLQAGAGAAVSEPISLQMLQVPSSLP